MTNKKARNWREKQDWIAARTASRLLGIESRELRTMIHDRVFQRGRHWCRSGQGFRYNVKNIKADLKTWLKTRVDSRQALGHTRWMEHHQSSQDYSGFLRA